MSDLTKSEQEALDRAIAIIVAHTPNGKASWSLAVYGYGLNGSCCYFDSNGSQHMLWDITTLSGVVQAAIDIEKNVESDVEKVKAAKIERLKQEIAQLEGAA